MAAAKSRLGRGLGGLISGGVKADSAPGAGDSKKKPKETKAEGVPVSAQPEKLADLAGKPKLASESHLRPGGFIELPINEIDANPYQPRREMDSDQISQLAASIRSEGLIQPIVVRKVGERFQLIAGERRWRACQSLDLSMIPARVIEASDASSAAMSLIENLQRENLNPIDEALAYASLIRDFDLTQEGVSERVGKGRATIANALRLLTLGKDIQGYLSKNLLSAGHAKVLLGIDDLAQRGILARRIIEERLSVREVEQIVRKLKSGPKTAGGGKSDSQVEEAILKDIEQRVASSLNTRVQLKHTAKKGKLIIEYQGNEDLQRILDAIGVK